MSASVAAVVLLIAFQSDPIATLDECTQAVERFIEKRATYPGQVTATCVPVTSVEER